MHLSRQKEHMGKGRKELGSLERLQEGQGSSEASKLWGQRDVDHSERLAGAGLCWQGLDIQDPDFFFNLVFILYWNIVDFQCCVSFRCTAK